MHLIARIVDIFKLTLLTIFVTITDVWRALITPLTCPNTSNWLNVSQSMSSFDAIRYVNIIKTFRLLFMIVLGIYGKFLIDLLICLKTCRSDFFFQGKMCAPEKSSAFQRFCTPERARPESGAQFVQAWHSNFTQNEMFLKCVHVIGFAWKQIRFTNVIFTLALLFVQRFSGLSELEIYSCVVNLILKAIVNQWIKPI